MGQRQPKTLPVLVAGFTGTGELQVRGLPALPSNDRFVGPLVGMGKVLSLGCFPEQKSVFCVLSDIL